MSAVITRTIHHTVATVKCYDKTEDKAVFVNLEFPEVVPESKLEKKASLMLPIYQKLLEVVEHTIVGEKYTMTVAEFMANATKVED